MIPLLAGALSAGLLGSPHCVGMCGAFATASNARMTEGLAWQAGRLGAYVALGALAGGAGSAVPVPGPVAAVGATALLAWFSLRLAGVLPALPIAIPFPTKLAGTLLAERGVLARLGFGALSSLLPCGLLWSAIAVAAASGGALAGGATLAAFWLGTAPALLVAARGLRLLAAARPWTRVAIAGAVFATGLWSIGVRTGFGAAPTGDAPECHSPAR